MPAQKIFVTVGTHTQQFDRLLKEMDELAGSGEVNGRDVFAQSGNCKYEPKNFGFKRFMDAEEYAEAIRRSSIVVSHGGAGGIINSLREGKALIIVPRLKKHGEHTNDHQRELADALEKRGKAIALHDVSGLGTAIRKAGKFMAKGGEEREGIISALEEFWGREIEKAALK